MSHPLAHTKRFELRLQPKQLEAWRGLADTQGVPVAEMVRHAMEYAAANMPVGYVKRIEHERFEALCAMFSVRTENEPNDAVTDPVRTECPSAGNVGDFVRTPSPGTRGDV